MATNAKYKTCARDPLQCMVVPDQVEEVHADLLERLGVVQIAGMAGVRDFVKSGVR